MSTSHAPSSTWGGRDKGGRSIRIEQEGGRAGGGRRVCKPAPGPSALSRPLVSHTHSLSSSAPLGPLFSFPSTFQVPTDIRTLARLRQSLRHTFSSSAAAAAACRTEGHSLGNNNNSAWRCGITRTNDLIVFRSRFDLDLQTPQPDGDRPRSPLTK